MFKNPLDIRVDFLNFYKSTESKDQLNVFRICELMRMKAEGIPGVGYDEVFNLGMIVAKMLRDCFIFR